MKPQLHKIEEHEFQSLFEDSRFWDCKVERLLDYTSWRGSEISRFPDGGNIVYAVGDQRVLKLFPAFYKDEYKAERDALRDLDWGLVPVEVPIIEEDGEFEDWPYLVLTKLDGELVLTCWDKLDSAARMQYAKDLGHLIRSVHMLSTDPIIDHHESWETVRKALYDSMEERHSASGVSETLCAQMSSFVDKVLVTDKVPVFLTGEYTPFNLFMQEKEDGWRLSGMFDFGDSFVGHPFYDLLGPIVFTFKGDHELVTTFLYAYGLSNPEINESLQKELFGYLLLHRFSNLPAYFERYGMKEPATLDEAAARLIGIVPSGVMK